MIVAPLPLDVLALPAGMRLVVLGSVGRTHIQPFGSVVSTAAGFTINHNADYAQSIDSSAGSDTVRVQRFDGLPSPVRPYSSNSGLPDLELRRDFGQERRAK